ncbi:MAG: hypothetical protein IJS07_05415, partial [Bacteroidales bacterium]|nr:hypothetical protein [Bacteroidales bacterium]
VITNFTLTDAEGKATIKEVPYGSYVLHVEMMGYMPYTTEKFFRKWKEDMGEIAMEQDKEYLKAAVVQDVGNPIIFKKDTIEFNASSFHVNTNAVLKDLLKRMPGMEVTDDGKVKFNGEEIDKITVGGRTFFFNDQSMALNNLPAAVVDKVQVIDKASDEARATGMDDGKRKKELNVELKQEYKEGWFGSVSAAAGTTIGDGKEDPLRDDRGLLYSGNVFASLYNETDQLTLIGNLQNFSGLDSFEISSGDEGSDGLSRFSMVGANASTTRIKDVEATAMVTYKANDTDSGSKSFRTTWQDDGDLESQTSNMGNSASQVLSSRLQFKKEKGTTWFHFSPTFRHTETSSLKTSETSVSKLGSLVNSSTNKTLSSSTDDDASVHGDIAFRSLGGKKGRVIRVGMNAGWNGTSGQSQETGTIVRGASVTDKDLTYITDRTAKNLQTNLRYAEPVGDKWLLAATGSFETTRTDNVRDAFDADGENDYYSTFTHKHTLDQKYGFNAQYKFIEGGNLTFGADMDGLLNEVVSRNRGVTDTTGIDSWNWFLTPMIRFSYNKGKNQFSAEANGSTMQPSANNILPALNLGNPSRLSMGNVNLKPWSQTNLSANWRQSNKEKFSSIFFRISGNYRVNEITSATWYDSDGIMYSIPVNTLRPNYTLYFTSSWNTTLNKAKTLSFNMYFNASGSSITSYQATGALPGVNVDTFDYFSFMSDFWGSEDGEKFYGGGGGFKEGVTRNFQPQIYCYLNYSSEHWDVHLSAELHGNLSSYSLDPDLNVKTLDTGVGSIVNYTSDNEWTFSSMLGCYTFKGYADGYGQPEWVWIASITKSVEAFTFGLEAYDILNQIHSLRHNVTANYSEDSYRLILGRYITFGVKWNFGKMNAANSRRASNAAYNMAW